MLRRRPEAPAVPILTMFDDPDVIAAALTAGAAGFVLKDAPCEQIIQATREVAGGKGWLDPAVVPQVFAAYRSDLRPRQAAETVLIAGLSQREREVLSLIGVGATNTEIASRLNIAEGTVKTHIGRVFTKLELRDRAAAVIFALRHGLAG